MEIMIMSMIALATVKVLDNLIITAKNIATYQNKKILTSLLVSLSQFMFYFLMKKVLTDTSFVPVIVLSISSGVGTYIAFILNDKFKKDVLYMNVITSSNKTDIERLSDYLRVHKIKHVINDSYTRKWEKTFSVLVFAKTKEESILIDNFMKDTESKYLREIVR